LRSIILTIFVAR